MELWTCVARHIETGELVGFHDVAWTPAAPRIVHIANTVVLRAHRGHALGKWLKAAILARIVKERPGVEELLTTNADSNAAMLGINHALGFQPHLATTVWRLTTDDAKACRTASA